MATTRPRPTRSPSEPPNAGAPVEHGAPAPPATNGATPRRRAARRAATGLEAAALSREGAVAAAELITPENHAILHHALEEAARLLRSDGAMAYLLDSKTGELKFADDAGIADRRRRRSVRSLKLAPGVGLFGRAVAERRILITEDYPSDPAFVHFEGADRVVEDLGIRSFIVAPMIAGDRVFGAMGTYSPRVAAFGEHDIALVKALADHAALSIANAGLIDQLATSRAEIERRADAERALREIGARITALRDPGEVLQLAVDEAAALLKADGARIDLLSDEDGGLYWAFDATTGRKPGLGPIAGSGEAKAGEGISGRAVRDLAPVLTGDYLTDARFEHADAPDAHVRRHQIRSVVAVPLVGDRGPLGTLTVYTGTVDAFDEDDAGLLEALAAQAAIAMTNARLIEELAASQAVERRRADEERALREIAARITATRNPSDILQDVVDEAARLLDAERVRIDLIGRGAAHAGYTFLGAGRHVGGATVDDEGVPYPYGASWRAIQLQQTVVVDDYLHDDSFEHDPELDQAVAEHDIRSLVITPLLVEGVLLGVLQVGAADVAAFGPEQVALAEALAHQAAIAIHNSRLMEALERSANEIRRRAGAEQELREIATRITAIRDPAELLQQVTDAARRLLSGERSQLDIVDPATGLIRWTSASGEGRFGGDLPGTHAGAAAEIGINAAAIAARETVITHDYLGDERILHVAESDAFVADAGLRSIIATPLLSESGLLGVLKVATVREDAFDDEDVALIGAFADQVVVAIQNARLIDELGSSKIEISRRADAERSVREIAANISALRDTEAILQQTVDEARRLLDSTSARIDMLDDDGQTLRWAYASGEDSLRTRRAGYDGVFRVGEGIAGRTVATGEAFRTGDYLADPRFEHVPDSDALVRETGFRSVLSAPLRGESGSLGAISVSSVEPDFYDDNQADLLQGLADQAAIAIQNARLIEELDRSSTELARRADAEQSLREIAARITAAIEDPGSLLQQVVDAAKRLVDADGSVLDLVDPDGTTIRWAFDAGVAQYFTPDEIATMTIPIGIGATGLAVAEDRVITASDDAKATFPDSEVNDRFFDATGYRSMIIAPVSGESGPLGALEVYASRPGAFDADDAAVMRSLASQAAIAITNAHIVEELERSRREVGRRAEAEQSLREIAARITAIRETDELLQHVADEAARLLDSDGAIIDLLDPISGTIGLGYVAGIDSERSARWATSHVGEDIVRRTIAAREPLYTIDYLGDPRFSPDAHGAAVANEIGLRAIAIAPLVSERGALGTLAVFSSTPGSFGPDEASLLGALADQAAIAMLNARLIDELERSQRELAARAETERSLRDIAARITSLGDPSELLARVVEESRRLLGSDGAHLTRMSDDGTYLVPVIVAGGMDTDTEDWLKGMQFPLGGGINGLAAEEVKPVWTYDYASDPRIPHEPDDDLAAERLGLRAMAAAPLRAPAGEVIGTLAVSYSQPREILPDDLDLLQGLADQAAIALTNANLYELLGESEARYRNLVQNSPDLVWSIDAEARFTFVSDATSRRLTGWSADELLGKHFGALVHETSRDVAEIDWTATIEAAVDGGRELRGRVNLLHKDGHPIPTEFIAFASTDEQGRFAGANGSVRDMSEQTRLERELRESEARFRFLIENSPDIIFSIDPSGRFTYISDTVRRSLGFEPDQLIGSHFVDLIEYDSHEVPGERFGMLADDPELELTNRINLRTADGRTRPFEVSSVGVRREGTFAGIQGAARDITERERLERELRDSEERYRFLVENAPDVVFSTDEQGVFTFLSDTIWGMIGYPPGELVGQHFSKIVQPASMGVAVERFAMLVEEPDVRQTVKLDLLRKDGGTVPVEVSSIGTTVDGRFTGIHGSTRDITERERLERDLRRQAGELASSQERAHLARELHDSVTQALFSMTLITRSTELLVDRDPTAAKERLGGLRDLQREALAEMRALIFELRPGNLESDGLLQALRTHSAALQGRIGLPIVVTSDLTDRLPLEIEEVLYRIAQEGLHNVVKHAGARQVELTVQRRAGAVVLRIRDDGKGFDQAAVPDGHLGLAGMRARADKIGAAFAVESRPGEGTTVEVTVPPDAIARAADQSAPPGEAVVSIRASAE